MKNTKPAKAYLKERRIIDIHLLTGQRTIQKGKISDIMTDFAASEIDRKVPDQDGIVKECNELATNNALHYGFSRGANWIINKLKSDG